MSPFLVAANGQRDANGGLTSIVKAAWSNLQYPQHVAELSAKFVLVNGAA